MQKTQMELSLPNRKVAGANRRPSIRRARSRWWFDRMRQIVDEAADWRPAYEPNAGHSSGA